MKPVSDLVLLHQGRAAVIIGGGESAPAHLKLAPEGALLISANQHGCLLTKCDYLVACDNKPGRRYVSPQGLVDLRQFGVPIISPRESMADYRLFSSPVNSSGCIAAWCAWIMGCAPICLAGMDLYLGKATYFHSPKAQSTGLHLPVGSHANKWVALSNNAPGAMLRPLGGPLVGAFPQYSPSEEVVPLPSREEIMSRVVGRLAKVKATGKQVEVDAIALRRGLRNGSLVAL